MPGQQLEPRRGNPVVPFESHASHATHIQPRLERHDIPLENDVVALSREVRRIRVAEAETVAAVVRKILDDVVVREDAPEGCVDVAPAGSGLKPTPAGFLCLEPDGGELALARGGLAIDHPRVREVGTIAVAHGRVVE